MSLMHELAVGKRPAPWPTRSVEPRFSLMTSTALVAPPMEARVWALGTKAGATKAESDSPSSESSAKPSSLMVPSIILAYAKSVAVISVMPAQGMSSSSTLRPNASLMRILSLLRASHHRDHGDGLRVRQDDGRHHQAAGLRG